jgi:hypothetical protein
LYRGTRDSIGGRYMSKKKRVFAIVSTNELPEEDLKKILLEELKRQYEIKYGKVL